MSKTNQVITVRDLHKAYGAVTAVDHISFEVQRGEIFGVVGPNVAAGLAQAEVVPPDLRSEQAILEDVFLSLTGREIRTE